MQKGIGKRIRDARKAAGLTQEELAERMGTSSVAVAQWETGRRNPKMGTVSKLAAALGVDVAELVPELKTLLKEKPEPPKMEPIFEDNGFLTARMTAIQKRAYEMAILLDFFDNVILQAITEEIVPKRGFFKDRYFPTGAGDIFKADEVLTEYRKGDRKLAAFVAPDVHDIPIARRGYEVHSYQPAYIAPSRVLTMDELKKRGFGEALYPGMDEAQRAARLLADDMNDMENRIAGTEEWMAAQTMISNGCTMQEMIDGKTKGDKKIVRFYDNKSDHTYTAAKKWNETGGDFWADIKAMCRMLSYRGLPAKDLILGTDAADYILADEKTRQLLDKNSGIIVGEIRQQLTQYDGVVFMGVLNFGGFMLNVFSVDETYEDENGQVASFFPKTAAMVTAPDCGHMMYGSITQMDYGQIDYTTYAAKRVAKLVVDQAEDSRKLRLGCRPLAAPKSYCPYIYAADVVQ